MRSRYSAFALGLGGYLLETWHASTRPPELDIDTPPQPKWIGLQILDAAMQDASHGTVHFVARCRVGGKAHRQEENSRFVCEDGRWYYLDGVVGES